MWEEMTSNKAKLLPQIQFQKKKKKGPYSLVSIQLEEDKRSPRKPQFLVDPMINNCSALSLCKKKKKQQQLGAIFRARSLTTDGITLAVCS